MRFYRGRAMKRFVYNELRKKKAQEPIKEEPIKKEQINQGCLPLIVAFFSIVFFLIVVYLIFGLFIPFMIAHFGHEHYYDFFETTTTCKNIGETTYRCIYEIDGFSCGKKKVVKDEDYAECDFSVLIKRTYTLEKETSLYSCKWCEKTIEKTNPYGKLYSNKIYDKPQYYESNDNIFQAKFTNQTHPKPDELYAVLHFFDRNGNHIGYAYSVLSCSNNGSGSVWMRLKNNIPDDYHEHRWDLSYERPYGLEWWFIRD